MDGTINSYNDYIRAVKQHMRNYNLLVARIEIAKEEIRLKQDYLDNTLNVAAAIAQYGEKEPSGTPELNKIEQAAADRMRAEEEINELKKDIHKIEFKLFQLDRSMKALDPEGRQIINEYFINKRSWTEIADLMHYSAKWVRIKCRNALRDMACTIWDEKAKQRFAFL